MTIEPDTPGTLCPAELDWSEAGEPLSRTFGDVYFSRDDGLAEARHVFIDGNRLRERWRTLTPKCRFSIAETGFGSGLNFLATWQLWRKLAPPGARLTYLATELHPLTAVDLGRVHALFPELAELAALLQAAYPPLFSGSHRLCLADGVELDLLFGDSVEVLSDRLPTLLPEQLARHGSYVDAWFLDGFAPARNPGMWGEELYDRIGWLSAHGATVATFTAAGAVRRGLEQRGFAMQKLPGFGRKREMLYGEFDSARRTPPEPVRRGDARHATWHLGGAPNTAADRRAMVIGAGIAGATIARKLAERGWQVRVHEAGLAPARRASGNPQAALYGRLSASPDPLTDFVASALAFAQRGYQPAWHAGHGERCGLFELSAHATAIAARYAAAPEFVRSADRGEARRLCGVDLPGPGLWFAGSGWLRPQALIDWLLDHASIDLVTNSAIDRIEHDGRGWRTSDGECQPVVVLATGHALASFAQSSWLPVRPIRGQVSRVRTTSGTAALRAVICGDGYLTPAMDGFHCIGATYAPGSTDESVRSEDDRNNLEKLARLLECPVSEIPQSVAPGSRAAIRAATPDYLPVVGPLADRERFLEQFKSLSQDATRAIAGECPVLPGLYVLGGLGSRGFAYAPLCAEHLASLIDATPSPLPTPLIRALHPARFLVRQLVRRQH